MLLWRNNNNEEVEVDIDFIAQNYLISRFNGKFDTDAAGLTVFISDQEEGIACQYLSNDPDFFKLVDRVKTLRAQQ